MAGHGVKRNFTPSNYELMSKSKTFDVGNSQIRVHPVKNQDYNIWAKKNSQQSRGTIQLLNENLPNLSGYELPEIVVADEKTLRTKNDGLGLAGYDHLSDTLFISNTLNPTEKVARTLNDGYFAANSFEDILVHELIHKKHWDTVKFVYNNSPKKYNHAEEVKHLIDEPLRAYVHRQQVIDPSYLYKISIDAVVGFENSESVNEVIAEACVKKSSILDKELLRKVMEVLDYGNNG